MSHIKPEKILIESSCYQENSLFSGVGYYSKSLAESFKEQGYRLHETSGPFSSIILNKIYRKTLIYTPFRYFLGVNPFLPKTDIAIFPNFANYRSPKSSVTATVIHDLTFLHYPEMVEKKNYHFLKKAVTQAIRESDFIITVSQSVKKEVCDIYNVIPDNIIVTPIPAHHKFHTIKKVNVYEKYNIPTKKFILYLGNLEPRKNLDSLLDAYVMLPQKIQKNYCLVIAGGKGWNFSKTQKKINTLIEKGCSIHQTGYIDDKDTPSLYRAASCFVLPSHYEGFGMPIVESLTCGTPVAASNIPVFKELSCDSITYFNQNKPKSIMQSIEKIITDKKPMQLNKNIISINWTNNVQNIIKRAKLAMEIRK